MTTLIAFATDIEGTVLCADRRVTHDNCLLTDAANKIIYTSNEKKLAIAAAGNWGTISVIAALLRDHQDEMPIPDTQYSATKFALWLRGLLLDNDLRPDVDPSEKDYTVGMLPCEFLIATPRHIITLTAGMDVYVNNRVATLGSGSTFALGSILALMKTGVLQDQELAKATFDIVASLDTHTSPDFDLVVVTSTGITTEVCND